MTATVQNLALAAKAMKYTFYAVSGCLDKNMGDHYESKQPEAEVLRKKIVAFMKQAVSGPMPVDTQKRWEEEDRQLVLKLKADPDYAAAFIALSERYIALFDGVTHESEDTATHISNIFTRKASEYGVELTQPLADGFAALNAPHLAAACRKLAL